MKKFEYDVTGNRALTAKRRSHGFGDSVDVQLSVTANVPEGKILAREVIEEAIRFRAKHGRDPEGFKIKLIRWRNPDRRGKGSAESIYTSASDAKGRPGWREYGTQADRFSTLARALRGTSMEFTITEHRKGGRKTSR